MAHAQKPDFFFRRNGRVHFNRRGTSVQSTTVSRGVRISGSNAGYTMFRGSVKSTGYPLHSPVSPFTSSPLRHLVPSHSNWTLLICVYSVCLSVFLKHETFVMCSQTCQWARASPLTKFLDHTQRSTTVARTTLDETSARILPDNTQHS